MFAKKAAKTIASPIRIVGSEASKKGLGSNIPGEASQAAKKAYYERGSQPLVEMNNWRLLAFCAVGVAALLALSIVLILPLKSIEIVTVSKDENGRLDSNSIQQRRFVADDTVKLAWVNEWTADLVEINPSTWQRGVSRALAKTAGTATDQARDYLNAPTNQPAILLSKSPSYVREMQRQSINMLQPNVVLIRYTLTSRQGMGAKETKAYAMTVNLGSIKQESIEQALSNPAGLAVSNFSVSEERVK